MKWIFQSFSYPTLLFIAVFSVLNYTANFHQTPESVVAFPSVLKSFIQKQDSLPRYVEANYSPFGRSPVVDAVLADTFYLPIYAQTVSDSLKKGS